ncbi:NUDIX hydrolase [Paracraurococcus ruber]|uniref:Nudix hydrolase domain-containing protein n=1 Tax=Paracraurococcus ruber TaxID=77675 RepID=A0ABS1CWR0_9PROT|nr:NUDIX hydrolase [Paracraurococcus ruber]MBK1658773.1 hypothetical protein [Paracraurococcus ruber]TDG32044.1 NUDIX hydrolase [Paracraurococcus ruber]
MPRSLTHLRRQQCAALPLRHQGDSVEVLLVTSRETRRWVLPKGWVEARRSAAEQAAREAFEEAGVRGQVAATPIGHYSYRKRMPDGGDLPCEVTVYPLEVEVLLDRWPEQAERERRWFTLEEAARLVHEGDLGALMLRLAAPSAA